MECTLVYLFRLAQLLSCSTDINTRVGLFVLPDFRAVGSAIRITSRHDAELYVLLKKVRTVGP